MDLARILHWALQKSRHPVPSSQGLGKQGLGKHSGVNEMDNFAARRGVLTEGGVPYLELGFKFGMAHRAWVACLAVLPHGVGFTAHDLRRCWHLPARAVEDEFEIQESRISQI